MRRVAVLYHFFPHYRSGVIKELARCVDAEFFGDERGVDGIEAHTFADSERFICGPCFYIGRLMIQPRLVAYCARSECDVFIFLANPNHITTWIGALIARWRGKRVVFWGHGHKSANGGARSWLRRVFFSIAHAFYTYGWRAKANAVALGADPRNIYVGFNSLDYERQFEIRLKCLALPTDGSHSNRLRVLCISRLTRACRYDMLLDAIKLATTRGLEMPHLVIIGDGDERAALEEQARVLGIPVSFLGATYDETAIAEQIFQADVTVSPGKIGLTAMHSLMYGTPVISNDNFVSQMPEVEAVAPGYTGDLFREGDVSDLASKLLTFKARYPDRVATRRRCFEMIDCLYNPKNQVDVLLLAIDGALAPSGDDVRHIFGEVA